MKNAEFHIAEPERRPLAEMSAEEIAMDWVSRVAMDTSIDEFVATDDTKFRVGVAKDMYEPTPSMAGLDAEGVRIRLQEAMERSRRYYSQVIQPLYDADPSVQRKNRMLAWLIQSSETAEEGSDRPVLTLLVSLRRAAESVRNGSSHDENTLQSTIREQFMALWAVRNTP